VGSPGEGRWGLRLSAPRLRVGLGMLLLINLGRLLVWLVALVVRHPLMAGVVLAVTVCLAMWGAWGTAVVLAVPVLVLVGWRLAHPSSFAWLVGTPLRGVWRGWWFYRRRWSWAMTMTGLHRTADGVTHLPRLRRVASSKWADVLQVGLLAGQAPEDYDKVTERLAHTFGALACRVRVLAPGWVRLTLHRADPLATPVVPPPIPDVPDLTALEVGTAEDGTPWRLRLLGAHLLIAGATGAGKGSVVWSLIRALGPCVRDGLVQLFVFDPKGGMEMAFGRDLFTRLEDEDYEQMADVLEDLAAAMAARTRRLKGVTRQHVPTVADPLVVIILDEIAALTAYCPDKAVRERIKAALALLLSQGRAPGYLVVGALQDPRKDVLPLRNLFPTRIALRLTEESEIDMILGSGARERGAECDLISKSLPGVGYITVEGVREPVRVRAGHVTDADIAELCTHYAPTSPSPGLAGSPSGPPRLVEVPDPDADVA